MNPKYSGVKPVISTGMTAKLVEVMTDNQLSRRRQETFVRVTANQLAKLMDREKEGETVFDLYQENSKTE